MSQVNTKDFRKKRRLIRVRHSFQTIRAATITPAYSPPEPLDSAPMLVCVMRTASMTDSTSGEMAGVPSETASAAAKCAHHIRRQYDPPDEHALSECQVWPHDGKRGNGVQ